MSEPRPLGLALRAALQFARREGAGRAIRLAAAGLVTLGPRGLIRRAAADARQAEDDARYAAWLPSHTRDAAAVRVLAEDVGRAPIRPRISIVTAVFNTDPRWLRRCIESVIEQVYAEWELCLCDDGSTREDTIETLQEYRDNPRIRIVRSSTNGGIVRASQAALALSRGDFVGFLDHDDELAPDALAEVVLRLNAEPDVDVVYTDEDKIDEHGARREPHFKPGWSPDLLRSCMYVSHLTVMRRSLVERSGGFREGTDGAQDHDLMLRASELMPKIAHIPRVLYHWRAGVASAAASQLSKRWTIPVGRRVLEAHLERIGAAALVTPVEAAGHYRIRYARQGTPSIEVLAPVRDVSALNAAARATGADYLVLCDASARPLSSDWLDVLVGHAQQPGIGAVGGIVYEAGRIDSAGLVTVEGVVRPAFRGEPRWTRGHLGNILDARNCAALDATCLATSRAEFDRLGGFDERALDAWAVDYCLRARAAGRRLVVAPACVLARETASPPLSAAALAWLRERWGRELERDPYYNPNFDSQTAVFRLPASS